MKLVILEVGATSIGPTNQPTNQSTNQPTYLLIPDPMLLQWK
jgi:hypothetical protein